MTAEDTLGPSRPGTNLPARTCGRAPSQPAARYRPRVPTWLGFVWTLPNTLLGLVVGLLTFQLPRLTDGALIFDRTPRGVTALMPRANRAAMTIGFVIVSARPVTGTLLEHERHHIRQYCAWGPLFIPVYVCCSRSRTGTARHPMELRAQRAAGELPGGVGRA